MRVRVRVRVRVTVRVLHGWLRWRRQISLKTERCPLELRWKASAPKSSGLCSARVRG